MFKITDEMIHPELRKRVRRKPNAKYSLFKTKIMKKLCRLLKGKHSKKMQYKQVYIPRSDGTELRVCVYSPLQPKDNVPGLLWMHGGGYAIGIPEQDDSYILQFVESSGCVVVSPDYTLSLDKPYPAALEDCYASLLWLRDNGSKYGMRSDQIFVGGNSAGGGLAAAVALYARENREVNIAFQLLLYPMLDDRPTKSSVNNDAPVWDTVSNNASWKLYLGEMYGKQDIPSFAVPARETNYSNLPPACAFVGSIDPFHDEVLQYIKNLEESGVPANHKVFDGCFHAFERMYADTEVAKEALKFMTESFTYAVQNYFATRGDV